MSLSWIRETSPTWNADRARILGGAPAGAFDLGRYPRTGALPGEWWRVESEGSTVGYGWMDVVWGDAEILLAVDPASERTGVGGYILHRLTREAASQGMRRMYNTVPAEHAASERVTNWLLAHGFSRVHGSNQLERPVPAGNVALGA